jgi:glycosyltransferase involved in cell wall biosynthesis
MDIGGAERAVYQLVREQIRCGVAADVLVASHAGYYGELTRGAGAVVHELGQRRAFDALRARTAASIIQRYDVAHFQSREPLLMAIATRRENVRLVYTHRSGLRRYSAIKRLRHRLVSRSLKRFDALTANTRQGAIGASAALGLPADRFEVIANGIDFSLLEPRRSRPDMLGAVGIARGATVIGTSAKLIPWKRIDRLVRATARLPQEVHCLVVGDGPELVALERLADELGVSQRVTFVGLQECIGDYLQLMDVFALPSGPDEGFGNSLVEAMGVGLPSVVFSDGGGLLEHVSDGHTGLVAAGQQDFLGKLERLIADPDTRRRLGDAGRSAVRSRYGLEQSVNKYLRLYGDVGVTPNADRPGAPLRSHAAETP